MAEFFRIFLFYIGLHTTFTVANKKLSYQLTNSMIQWNGQQSKINGLPYEDFYRTKHIMIQKLPFLRAS